MITIEASALDSAASVGITSEAISAYMAQNHIPAAEIPALIASVHATFANLGRAELSPTAARARPRR